MKPADFQYDASGFMFERNSSMMFAKVGSGKTLTYLLTLQDLIEGGVIRRAMIVPPLRVAKTVWTQEARKWDIPLSFSLCTGEMSKSAQAGAIAADTDCLIANYDIMEKILEDDAHGCDGLVFDELSKLRNPTGKRQKAARRGKFIWRSGGTGTPAPNGLGSIYGMAHAVGLGHLVGRNHDKWQRQYFYPTDYEQRSWAPFPDTEEKLAALIKPYTYVLANDAVKMPPVVRPPMDIELPRSLRRTYDEMRGTSLLSDEELVIAGSAAVLRNKLRQIASGFAYRSDGTAAAFDPYRLEILADIVEEMQGEPIIIVYEFREQLAMMQRKWPGLRYLGGGSADDDRTIDDWNAGRVPVLGLHPQSAGHGLNIQFGGNTLAWWQLPDDLELYDQTIGRLVRTGQAGHSVYSYEPTALDTVDVAARARAVDKTRVQDGLWEALRR